MHVSVDGARIFFDVEGAKLVPEGPVMVERPTILLLHGGPGFDHSGFKPSFGAHLADLAQVVYVDHRGNGRSGGWDQRDRFTLEQWGDDIVGFCEALGIEHPVVWGWSFGGMVAQAYAARHPGHASKLVLQSTGARCDVERIAEGFRRVAGEAAAQAARRFWSVDATPEDGMAYFEHCLPRYSPTPTDPLEFGRAVINLEMIANLPGLKEFDLLDQLPAITAPTLVFVGDVDPVMPVEAAEEIVEHLTGSPSVELVRIPGAGHDAHRDAPEPVWRAARAFLESFP